MSLNIDLSATVEIIRFLEVSKSQSEIILDSLPGLFLIIDVNGMIIRGNRNLAEFFSEDFENLIGQRFDERIGSKWTEFSGKMSELKNQRLNAIEFDMAVNNRNSEETNFFWNISLLKFQGRENTDLNIYLIVGRKISESESTKPNKI